MSNQIEQPEPESIAVPQTSLGQSNRFWRIFLRLLTAIGNLFVEFFLRLKIRLKLSLIVGISIAFVTFVISSIAVRLQERELRTHTRILGTNILQSLTAVAEDNLLLTTLPVLQDYVKNFSRRKIPGLEHLFVTDRSGKIVAHLESDSINLTVSPDEWEILATDDSAM